MTAGTSLKAGLAKRREATGTRSAAEQEQLDKAMAAAERKSKQTSASDTKLAKLLDEVPPVPGAIAGKRINPTAVRIELSVTDWQAVQAKVDRRLGDYIGACVLRVIDLAKPVAKQQVIIEVKAEHGKQIKSVLTANQGAEAKAETPDTSTVQTSTVEDIVLAETAA